MLKVENVYKIYKMGDTEVHALDGVSLHVKKGEFVSIIGPSGSGKSTLMNILGCLDVPSKGNYYIDGVEVNNMTDDELAVIRNEKIGFIFQNFNLLPKLTILENCELPLIYRGVSSAERRKLATASLERVGLGKRLDHTPLEISGGQQQRVAIARALATTPPLILADEPTGNLDSKSGKEVMQMIHKIHEEGNTIVLITHDNDVAKQAQRIVRIQDGKLYEESMVK